MSKIDPISTLHYKNKKIPAERLRHLCKSNRMFGINEASVKAFNHIKECEYCRLAKSTRSSFPNVVPRCPVVGYQWYVESAPFRTPSLIHGNVYIFAYRIQVETYITVLYQ